MERKDTRTCVQIRPMACEQRPLDRADGSARFDHGKTSMLAAVYGPGEVPLKKDMSNRATIEVVYKPKNKAAGVSEKAIELKIREAVESIILSHLHPHSLISILIQVLHDDGAALACAINAAFMAILDAGIPTKACLAASTIAVMQPFGMMLDPTLEEEQNSAALMTFASTSDPDSPGCVMMSTTGTLSAEEILEAQGASFAHHKYIFAFFRKSIERRLVHEHKVPPQPVPVPSS